MKMTEFIAIYAAVLSTAIFVWNITASRAKIVVELIHGAEEVGGEIKSGVFLSIQNPSHHTVHINSVSLLYPFRKVTLWGKVKHIFKYRRLSRYIGWVHSSLIFQDIETGLPASIEARKSHSFFIPENLIWEMLGEDRGTEIAAEAQDALWRNKYSGVIKINPRRTET